jgi:hypothetical protein
MFHQPSNETVWLIAARLAGAIAGSAISVAYILPKGRREAALRFLTGVVAGLVFGSSAGLMIADRLGLAGRLSAAETALTGAAIASLCAWTALGMLARYAARLSRRGS